MQDIYWYLIGDPEARKFKTKLEAEIAARLSFPEESAARRYQRVMYKEVETGELTNE